MDQTDAFIPENPDLDPLNTLKQPTDVPRTNLAEDESLCKDAMAFLKGKFEQYRSDREELKDLWNVADWMWKCGQDESTRETERTRTDRSGDNLASDLTKTKAQKVGSTLFFRQVRALAAQFCSVVFSRRDPFTYRSRNNPDVFYSDSQADEMARQHSLLMRWTRDAEKFPVKFVNLAFQLIKYGNIPVYMRWKRRTASVLDRWPVPGTETDPETGDTRKVVTGTKIERRDMLVDNRPSLEVINNLCFYADQRIGDVQQQQAMFVESMTTMAEMLENREDKDGNGDFLNVDNIDKGQLWKGDETGEFGDRESNAGYGSATNDTQTGTFRQFDCHALLPIDESKPKGKRWNPEKHAPKKYWLTVIGGFDNGVCLRIERNPDPDDEYPIEMIRMFPDDDDKLYHISLAQILRGNYTEATTTKQQLLDAKTLNNNRPLKVVGDGAVHTKTGSLQFGKDQVYFMDEEKSMGEFALTPVWDNMPTLEYLENDSELAAGTQRLYGQAMGGRTSSNEAQKAYMVSALPHKMLIKYVLEQLFCFYGRKGPRFWHLYADENQILKVTDEGDVYQNVRPIDLFGDFDVEIDIVDEYEQDLNGKETFAFAVQSIMPLSAPFMDMRAWTKEAHEKFLHWDVSKMLKPDRADADAVTARHENQMFMNGQYVEPKPDEDHDAMLREHEGFRIKLRGAEDDPRYANAAQLTDRHIAETNFMKARVMPAGTANPPAPPGNTTEGMTAGNFIAGQLGAQVPQAGGGQ